LLIVRRFVVPIIPVKIEIQDKVYILESSDRKPFSPRKSGSVKNYRYFSAPVQ
jgi:hypothetical protein